MKTIAEYLGGTDEQPSTDFRGQSFTTHPGRAFNNIRFNFFAKSKTGPIGDPYASGSAFLFSMPFSGGPADMSSTSPGFLGEATAVGGFWTFDSNVSLDGGTKYFLYARTPLSLITGGGDYRGGSGYIVSGGFASQPWQQCLPFNFRVTGNPIHGRK